MTDYAYSEPTSVAEMQQRYAEIRKRTYPVRRKPVFKPAPPVRKLLTFICHHDAHVVAYRNHIRAREQGRRKARDFELFRHVAEDILSNEPGITWRDITGPSRKFQIVTIRQAIIHAIKREDEFVSYPKLGRMCGGRDHTTAMWAIRTVTQAIKKKHGVWRRTATGREYFVRTLVRPEYRPRRLR